VVLGMLGLDQHELGARAVAVLLRDAGMEVVYLGKFNTPERFAQVGEEEGADLIGVSVHSWEYLELVPELMRLLAGRGSPAVPVVVGGSVITPEDERTLKALGVAEMFGAGVPGEQIVERIRALGARERY